MSSSNTERKIEQLLRTHNFRLVRQTKHFVYQEPGGRVFVTGSTPSDWRAMKNQLSILQRVIANPPQPMVLAIEEYEREAAALVIAGQQKAQAAPAGMGSGKQRPSRGTGYSYVGENLCEHGNPKRYPCSLCMASRSMGIDISGDIPVESRQTRQERRKQERRATKLAKREAKTQAKQEEEAEFQKMYGPFLTVVERLARENEEMFLVECESIINHPTWQKDLLFCELPPQVPNPAVWGNRRAFENEALLDIGSLVASSKSNTLEEKDEALEFNCEYFQNYLGRSENRIRRVMKAVRNEIETIEKASIGALRRKLNVESEKYKQDIDDLNGWDLRTTFSRMATRIHDWAATLAKSTGLVLTANQIWSAHVVEENLILRFYENDDDFEGEEVACVNFTNPAANVAEKVEAVAA